MNATDKTEYEKLTTVADRAEWLLRAAHSREDAISVVPDIKLGSLTLFWRVSIVGVSMPTHFDNGSEEEAIEKTLAWLRAKSTACEVL